ncbi:hypothetical protein Tco_0718200 [Tanacetum coccineum]
MENLEFCDKQNIVNWEYILLGMTEAKDSEVCKITRADGSSSFHGDIQALLRRLDRQDLSQLYSLVQERFKDHPLEGHDLDLWGDLRMIFDPNEEDDIWLNQQYWELLRWKLHEYSGVHSLFLDGTSIQINMLVEKKYPLKKEILVKMINLKIEAEEESTMAHELIKFIKSQIAEQNLKVNHKFRGGLLGIKELLQDNAAEGLNTASSNNLSKLIKDPFNWNLHNLSELELKKILIEKMESNKSINRSNEQKNIYKALVEAYESDKLILDTDGDTVSFKRRRDDEDKDEEPSIGSNRGSKRRRAGKEPESTSAPKEKTSNTTGKSTDGSKSQHKSASESAHTEEPMHNNKDLAIEEQSDEETSQHSDWFQKPAKIPTPDRDWNKTLPAVHGPVQPWLSNLAREEGPHKSFDELMDTPLDFSAFMMNRLKINTLTPELLAGLTFELMKDTFVPFDHFINNDLAYLSGGVSSHTYTTSVTKTKAADYGHIKWIKDLVPNTIWNWITVHRDDDKLYTFKEGDFKRLRLQDIKDMLILLVQGKLTNLNVEDRLAFGVSLRMFTRSIVIQRRVEDLQLGVESYQKKLNITKPDTYRSDLKRRDAYTAYSNPRGFIYQNKDKKNKLMRIDELHKFSDGTLDDVRTALNDRLKGIRMEYLPQTIWRQSDRERAKAMIQAIDKQLKSRRIMRSLERFVGGRPYGGDLRLLQRTI